MKPIPPDRAPLGPLACRASTAKGIRAQQTGRVWPSRHRLEYSLESTGELLKGAPGAAAELCMKRLDNRNDGATEGPGSVIMRRGGIPGDRRECVERGDGHRAPSKMFHVKRPTIPPPKPAHQGGRSPHLRRKHVLPDAGRSVRDGPHPAAPGLIDGPFTHAGLIPLKTLTSRSGTRCRHETQTH